jgi:hypothetical protein
MTTATARAPAETTGEEPPTVGQTARRSWLRWRAILLALIALVVVAFVLIAIRPVEQTAYLDPDSATPQGSRALVAITRAQGTPVTVVRSVAAAAAAMRGNPDQTLVVVQSARLVQSELVTLSSLPGSQLLIEPDGATLRMLAPGITAAGGAGGSTSQPDCGLPGARAAGDIALPGGAERYLGAPNMTSCYGGVLTAESAHGTSITVLGSGRPLTNQYLADDGDAALGMNLLQSHPSAVWLVPPLPKPGSGGHQSFFQLVPLSAKLVFLQLCLVVVAAALWRVRRLGPLVAEPLPVAVRSAEAVEGRARLYRSRRATAQAAAALRAASLERLTRLLGLSTGSAQASPPGPFGGPALPPGAQEIVAAVSARTGLPQEQVGAALFGGPPADDADLVRLAGFLDALERKVRTS